MRTVRDDSENVSKWVAAHVPHVGGAGFGACTAIGVVSNDGSPLCGVVFHDYQPMAQSMQISLAAVSARWATRNILADILHYPFDELGLFKVWSVTPASNERAQRFALGIGFRKEATLRHQFGPKSHAVFLGMLATEYRERYGKAISAHAA
jgi:hypothetical protein